MSEGGHSLKRGWATSLDAHGRWRCDSSYGGWRINTKLCASDPPSLRTKQKAPLWCYTFGVPRF